MKLNGRLRFFRIVLIILSLACVVISFFPCLNITSIGSADIINPINYISDSGCHIQNCTYTDFNIYSPEGDNTCSLGLITIIFSATQIILLFVNTDISLDICVATTLVIIALITAGPELLSVCFSVIGNTYIYKFTEIGKLLVTFLWLLTFLNVIYVVMVKRYSRGKKL